jgi:TonB family protein
VRELEGGNFNLARGPLKDWLLSCNNKRMPLMIELSIRRRRTAQGLCCALSTLVINCAMAAPLTTPVKIDPNHPPHAGAEYYPAESTRLHEEGTCKVKVTVAADGTTGDITLTQSTGYPRLDAACMFVFIDGGLLPATVDGQPVEKTIEIPIAWRLPPPVKPSPRVDVNNPPHLGERYYPGESKRLGEQGKCKVSMLVTADGKIHDIKLTQSSGFPRLDQACLKAFAHGGLLPAVVDGKPVDMQTEESITWYLTP